MNDKFAADLRRHFLETADERPAVGQLAAVVDAIDTTRQHLPLVARLTWTPGRVGGIPSNAIRLGLVAAALALAMVAGALFAGGGPAPRPTTPFEGSWITIDPGDGSGMTLTVGPGLAPEVYFEDGYASGAACLEDEVKRFTARGTATIIDNLLVARFPDGGGCGSMSVGVAGWYEHETDSDMLVDQDGLSWGRPLARPRPSQQALPTQLTDGACIEFESPTTYTALTGDLAVSLTVPATDTRRWRGERDTFFLGRATCDPNAGATVFFLADVVDEVYTDACRWQTSRVEVPTARAAADALSAQAAKLDASATPPVEMPLGSYLARRLDVALPAGFDTSACDDGFLKLYGEKLIPVDITMQVYVVDLDGSTLVITANYDPDEIGSADLRAIDLILETLRVEP